MQPIGRFSYLFCGVLLVVVKFAIDALVAKLFGRQWSAFIYWSPLNLKLFSLSGNERNFAFALAAVSVPFIAVGIWLTVRRLRTLRLHPWLSILFFLPVVNLIFFAFLIAAPEFEKKEPVAGTANGLRIFQEDSVTSMLGAVGIAALCAGLAVWFSIVTLGSYGWGVFLAVPFCTGLLTTLLVSIPKTRSYGYCLKSSLLAMGMTGAGLLAIGFEGLVCLVMCIPIAVPIAMIGVLVAREIIRPGPRFLQFQITLPLNRLRSSEWLAVLKLRLHQSEFGLR
ncbi:MAG: hypothetical protein NTW74_17000 [Acidobacteria bacterium]|nr:hypothetical protein [Acidobacteriota bacterium]